MPFQPPPQQNPLEQLFQLYQLQESMNASKRQQAQEALSIAVRLAEAGGDPRQVQGVDPSRLPLLEQLSSRAQEEQRIGRLGMATQLAQQFQIPEAMADPAARQRAMDALSGVNRDMMLDPASAGTVGALTQVQSDAILADQRRKLEDEQRSNAEARARIAANEEANKRSADYSAELARNANLEQSFAERIAAVQNGTADPREATAVALEMGQMYGDKTPEVARRVTSAARALSYQYKETVIKNDPSSANIRAVAETFDIPENEARMVASGLARIDPVTNRVAVGTFPKKWEEGRMALADSVNLLADLEETFGRAERELAGGDALVGGIGTGSDFAQRLFQATQLQNPVAAEYTTKFRNFVLQQTKAVASSRGSDMDLRFVLAQIPTLEELGAGSAAGRFKALNDIQRVAIESPFNRSLGRDIASRKTSNAGMTEAMSLVKELESGGNLEAFNQKLGAWKAKYGAQFQIPGVGGGTGDGAGFADEFFGTHLGGP